MDTMLAIDRRLCYQCALCVAVCADLALTLHPHHLSVDHESCTRCEDCIVVCPTAALALR